MNNYWISCTVRDLMNKGEAELKTGPFGTQLHASDYVKEGTPVINVRNIGLGSILPEKLEFISNETVQRLRSHLLEQNDIVFGRKGAVERHAFIQQNHSGWFQGSDCLRLRLKSSSVDPRFISYCFLMETHKRWMENQCSHGSTMTSLNQDIISRIPLYLPPLLIQRKIAAILSAYDDLIENNTRRIAILEEMARSLYEEWFMRFRFPGHEKNGMVDSVLGMVPEGWEVVNLGEVLTLQRGFDLPTSQRHEGNIPVYAATGLTGMHNEAKVKGPGVLTGRSGSLGTVMYVEEDFWPLNTTLWVKDFRRVTPIFAFYLLKGIEFTSFNSGAAVPTLNRNDVHKLPIILPPQKLIGQFDEFIFPIFRMIRVITEKNANLRRTRDLLLPKLIAGEVDVEGLEIEVGEGEDAGDASVPTPHHAAPAPTVYGERESEVRLVAEEMGTLWG